MQGILNRAFISAQTRSFKISLTSWTASLRQQGRDAAAAQLYANERRDRGQAGPHTRPFRWDYARLEAVVLGVRTHVEIWDLELWKQEREQSPGIESFTENLRKQGVML